MTRMPGRSLMNSALLRAAVLSGALGWLAGAVSATQDHTNYDEAKVGPYTLPPLLVCRDGTPVRSAADWTSKRRPEILQLYRDNVHGRMPSAAPRGMSFRVVEQDRRALAGTAHRKQIEVRFAGDPGAPVIHVLLYTPANAAGPVPVFLTLHFSGNWAIVDDPGVRLYEMWDRRYADQGDAAARCRARRLRRMGRPARAVARLRDRSGSLRGHRTRFYRRRRDALRCAIALPRAGADRAGSH